MSTILVKCFKHDEWVEIDAMALVAGDTFVHQSKTYIATGAATLLDGKPHIHAQPYAVRDIVINLDKKREFITMAMDCVGAGAHDFGDGTLQIVDFERGMPCVYSPRLPEAELNAFCAQHRAHYQAFHQEHEATLYDKGQPVAMTKFW
ncbi:hypothetical protein KW507_15675 [Vibrio fluvialis]|nr:hypothetical protein [Vibrio fluvialis]